MKIIGREKEIGIINELLESDKAEFLAIYGRRRVGKTFLVNSVLGEHFSFSHAGLSPNEEEDNESNMRAQLDHFFLSLKNYGYEGNEKPRDWLEAFYLLSQLLKKKDDGNKQVIFLDELPWMDTPKSNFVRALEGFWNTFICYRNVLLVTCGSAISWMRNKLINNHGGLYGRVTRAIELKQFSVKNVKLFLESKGIVFSDYDIVNAYMVFGGIPYYLNYLSKDKSLSQNIDYLFFENDAPFKDEYDRLFSSIFTNPQRMMAIVATLNKRNQGLTRKDLCQAMGITDNGALSEDLDALILCSFIEKYNRFGSSKREVFYKLIDPFCKFYLEFVADKSSSDDSFWLDNQNSPKLNTWRGFAFENFCFMHIKEIKTALGINGVSTNQSSWNDRGDSSSKGAQIDMIIERNDNIVNLCEMKFYSDLYCLSKESDLALRNKVSVLGAFTRKKDVIRNVLITTFGIVKNGYHSVFSNVITLDDFFK